MQDLGTVYLRVHTKEKDARYSLGLNITKDEWEKYRSAKYKASEKLGSLDLKYKIFAEVIERVKDVFHDGVDTKNVRQTVNAIKENTIKDVAERELKPGIIKKPLFTDFLAQMIKDMVSGDRVHHSTAKRVAPSYIKRMKAVLSVIRRYEDDMEEQLTIDDVNIAFSREFVSWSADHDMSPNYTSGNMRFIRVAMGEAYLQGKTKCVDFRRPDFIPKAEEVEQVYLKPEQIEEMRLLDVSSKKKILELVDKAGFSKEQKEKWLRILTKRQCDNVDVTKDTFVVGCLTGQRLSDYSRINDSMFTKVKGNEYIHLIQQKTGKEVYIPLDYRVKEIIKRRNGSLPHVWEGDFNDYCRLLAELLHWTWEAKIDRIHLGVKRGPRFCDMVSSHTARRTFASNAYAAGVPLGSIIAITGHCSERELRKYLKLQAEDKGIIAAKDMDKVMRLEED